MHGRATSLPAGTATVSLANPQAHTALREIVDQRLAAICAKAPSAPVNLNAAVRHALLAPGKRVRPMLTMLSAAQFGADPLQALDAGCALELVHTASLVLDDLPCMDDACTRRGIASTHTAFGESTAVLAAIAMLTRAFGVIAEMDAISPSARLDLTAILSHAAGAEGLAAGQERDLHDRSTTDAIGKINDINDQKTGVLFVAAVQMGARIANVDGACMAALETVGREIGLAFQALDDVIDMAQSSREAGKDTGKDGGKATVATVMGLDDARSEVGRHIAQAHAALEPFAPASGPLRCFMTAIFDHAAPRQAKPAA